MEVFIYTEEPKQACLLKSHPQLHCFFASVHFKFETALFSNYRDSEVFLPVVAFSLLLSNAEIKSKHWVKTSIYTSCSHNAILHLTQGPEHINLRLTATGFTAEQERHLISSATRLNFILFIITSTVYRDLRIVCSCRTIFLNFVHFLSNHIEQLC